eukprot:CAMPEP_0176438732 /NCGR_PEP_ID=MMETSP0127-20121128/19484_1 /TAXON_ID=938130 /ORGANISM="Platyophrya macrostoma, Strain WH" /LENGTH=205 /DNA_ID=CAMNT_0017822789 /DNA_START=39 /DNA_END=656 /DNA_ORIENTATION=+
MAESKPQGAGSVWNVNNWHWESKNYTEFAKEVLSKKLLNYTFKKDDLTFVIEKIAKVKGEAQLNIRKGKQILCYEFDVELEWMAENEIDSAYGEVKVAEINESDMDFEVTSVSVKEKTGVSDKAKEVMRKHFKKELENLLKTYNTDLTAPESDPQKLEEEKRKKEEAAANYKKLQQEKGAEKERIFEEQKLKEQQLKEELSKVTK